MVSTPDVTEIPRTSEDEAIVLASDGLWDVISSNDVGKFVRKELGERPAGSGLGREGGRACGLFEGCILRLQVLNTKTFINPPSKCLQQRTAAPREPLTR